MGLKDVDRVEIDLSLVLLRKLVQGGNLPPERRSGIAPEDQHHRLRSPERSELDGRFSFEGVDCEIRSRIAGIQVAAARLIPHGLERKEEIRGLGHVGHHMAKLFRRLVHGPIHEPQETEPRKEKTTCDPCQPAFRRRLHASNSLRLFRQRVRLQISLRRDPERICDTIKERKHRGNVNGLGNLRLGPAMIPQNLDIFRGGSVRCLGHFLHIIEKRAFRRA